MGEESGGLEQGGKATGNALKSEQELKNSTARRRLMGQLTIVEACEGLLERWALNRARYRPTTCWWARMLQLGPSPRLATA